MGVCACTCVYIHIEKDGGELWVVGGLQVPYAFVLRQGLSLALSFTK